MKERNEEVRLLRKRLADVLRENRRLKRDLDPLTGLHIMKKSFAADAIARMLKVEEKREKSFLDTEHTPRRKEEVRHCLVFVDLDGLCWTNNNPEHGYAVGDHILVALANILDRWRRRDDLVYRRTMGGDEFILLFAGSSEDETAAQLLKNRARFEAVIEKRFPKLVGKVSFSFGVQEVFSSDSQAEIHEALEQAGKNMHVWKDRRKMERRATNLREN